MYLRVLGVDLHPQTSIERYRIIRYCVLYATYQSLADKEIEILTF